MVYITGRYCRLEIRKGVVCLFAVSDTVVCSQHLSRSSRVLAAMGKNELLATKEVDVIDVDSFIGKVQHRIPFLWFLLMVL